MAGPAEELFFRGSKDTSLYGRYMNDLTSLNQQRLLEYLTQGGDTGFYLIVNDEELIKQMDYFESNRIMYNATINAAAEQFLPQVKPILSEIIIDIADRQDENAFPPEFVDPLLRAIKYLPDAKVTGNAPHLAVVELPNLYAYLGAEDEYAAAFHHGALLPGSKNTGPFTSEEQRADIRQRPYDWSELKTQNPARRYLYWKAVFEGKQFITLNRGREHDQEFGQGSTFTVPVTGSRKDTINARLDAWRRVMPGGAPQWLLLEYGQPKWSPKIQIDKAGFTAKIRGTKVLGQELEDLAGLSRFSISTETSTYTIPGNISSKWVDALAQEWTSLITITWAEQIERFNKTSTKTNFDTKAVRLRSPITGRFLKRGSANAVFRTSSSRSVEDLMSRGGWDALETPFQNAPMSYRDFFRKAFPEDEF